jgi:YfiR/HmsC-like
MSLWLSTTLSMFLRCHLARLPVSSAPVITLLFVCVSLGGFTSAQAPSNVYAVKAAFIFHFAQLVDWPPDVLNADPTLTFCLQGESAYVSSLTALVEAKQIASHPIQVREVKEQDDLRSCHVINMRAFLCPFSSPKIMP